LKIEAGKRGGQPQPATFTLFIGTHALLTGGFDLPKLGLVIIDEQHKFGVTQRETLVRKGELSASAGDDGDADSAHARPDALRRPGCFGD
jgi:hypothetical protein